MSTENQLQGYGYVSDTDESLRTKSGGKFGLNHGTCFLSKFAYNPNVAKEGQPVRDAIEVVLTVSEKEFKTWFGPISKVFDGDGQEITDTSSPEYIAGFNKAMNQQNGVITHYLKSVGVTEEAIRAVTATPVFSFAEYAQKICSLLPADYNKRPLDLFLEYQWKLGTKADGSPQDRTFPTLPGNMKGGAFLVPSEPGVWVEKRETDGALSYENSNGQKHPFDRSANFMSSHKGTQQVSGNQAQNPNNPMAGQPLNPTTGQPAPSTWGAQPK